MINFRRILGLSGVAKDENYRAQQWGRRFQFCMVLIAIWLPLQWRMENSYQILPETARLANWFTWFIFVAETFTLLFLVQNRWHYLKRNWMNLVIIFFGIPFIWQQTPLVGILRSLQLLLILRLLVPWWDFSVRFLSHNRLGTTLFAAFFTTTLAGVLMSAIDPHFPSAWVGIWWAWETVTTVGYGDQVPVSFEGRILAIFVMLMGIAFISLLTANFSAYFISKGQKKHVDKEEEILKVISEGINQSRQAEKSIILITHYQRLLNYVKPDIVHILVNGKIVKTGTSELAMAVETQGFRDMHE